MTNEELFNKNINIAYKLAWQYKNSGIDMEDIKQICLYALWKAVITYKENYTFSTYAYQVIFNEMNYYLRQNRKYFSDKYFSEKIGVDDLILEDTLEDKSNMMEEIENKIDINSQINSIKNSKLNDDLKIIFELHMQGHKQREIAKILNCSQANVSRKLCKIKKFRRTIL